MDVCVCAVSVVRKIQDSEWRAKHEKDSKNPKESIGQHWFFHYRVICLFLNSAPPLRRRYSMQLFLSLSPVPCW